MFSRKCDSKARLDGKTVVITGANTGLGKATAMDLYRRGGRIIMACRDLKRAQDAADDIKQKTRDIEGTGELVLLQLNLASLTSVRQCAQHLLSTEKYIHLLINNAGVCFWPKELTEDGFEIHFGVNHLGHFLLTLLLIPRIIRSAPARIVVVSSSIHNLDTEIPYDDLAWNNKTFNTFKAYSLSKLANIYFTTELANRLTGTKVSTYVLCPGAVATDAGRNMDKSMFRGAKWLYKNVMSQMTKTPMQGAQTIIYCSVDETVASDTGQYYSNCRKSTPSAAARDPTKAKKLWEESIRLVGLEDWDPFTEVNTSANNSALDSFETTKL